MSNYKLDLQTNNTILNSNNVKIQNLIDQTNILPSQKPVEWSLNEDAILTGGITEYTNSRITTLRDGAFLSSSLQSINLPICESVGNQAFRYNNDLTTVNIPFCKDIGQGAFQFCNTLQSIDLPNCINIGSGAFSDCIGLQSINLPVCEYISGDGLAMTSLTSINLPACQHIGRQTFAQCFRLQSINLPVCEYIGENAFQGCHSLKTITLPACKLIEAEAFEGSALLSIYLPGPNLCELSNSDALTSVQNGIVVHHPPDIYVPASLVEAYKSAPEWSDLKDYIKAIITFSIEDNNFEAIEGMTWQEWIDSKYNIEKTWNTSTGTFTAKIITSTDDGQPSIKDKSGYAYGIINNEESADTENLTDIIIDHQQYFLAYGGLEG